MERIAPPETEQWGDSLQSTRPEWGESPHSAETPILPFKLFSFAELRKCRVNDDFSGGCQHGKPLGDALAQNVHFNFLGTAVRTAAGAASARSHGGVCAGCLGSDPYSLTPVPITKVRLSRSPSVPFSVWSSRVEPLSACIRSVRCLNLSLGR